MNVSGLTCEQISIEYKTNTEVAQSKIAKNRSNDKRELLLGILVWPGLFDLKNADGNEGNALLDRNIYLRELAKSKPCVGVEAWPEQPARYTMIDHGRLSSNTYGLDLPGTRESHRHVILVRD